MKLKEVSFYPMYLTIGAPVGFDRKNADPDTVRRYDALAGCIGERFESQDAVEAAYPGALDYPVEAVLGPTGYIKGEVAVAVKVAPPMYTTDRWIEAIPVKEWRGQTTSEWVVEPYQLGLECACSENLLKAGAEAAKGIGEICAVVVHDRAGKFLIARPWGGRYRHAVLFNAEPCEREEADLRAVVCNDGKGALTKYTRSQFLRYAPGKIWDE